jgi:hypothetical protein
MTVLGIIMGGAIGAITGTAFRRRDYPILTLSTVAALCMIIREVWP